MAPVQARRSSPVTMSESATQPTSEAPPLEPVERFEPERLRSELVAAEHLARYHWAGCAVEGLDVLDAGCGVGYGSALLASFGARRCVGVDIAPEAVEAATEAYAAQERLEFRLGDIADLAFEDGSFDVVTCFETIEHVGDQEAVVDELARVLRAGGVLLISSPNRNEYPPGNPYHVRELTPDELLALLSRSFGDVKLLRQHNWLVSAILDDYAFALDDSRSAIDLDARKLEGRAPGRELYTVAAASDGPIDPPRLQALMTHGLEVRRWIERIEQLEGELRHELNETRRALAAREQELLELRDRRSIETARLERQAYWLERGEIDLDAWMRRRPVRLAFRALRLFLRLRRRLVRRRAGGGA